MFISPLKFTTNLITEIITDPPQLAHLKEGVDPEAQRNKVCLFTLFLSRRICNVFSFNLVSFSDQMVNRFKSMTDLRNEPGPSSSGDSERIEQDTVLDSSQKGKPFSFS